MLGARACPVPTGTGARAVMTLFDKLAEERRARLVAERLLAQRARLLEAAQQRLAMVEGELQQLRAGAGSTPTPVPAPATASDPLPREAVMAERRLWDSVNTIRDGFAVFDAAHELVIANQAYLGVFTGFPEVRPGIRYRRLLEILAFEGLVHLDGASAQDWLGAMLARWEDRVIAPTILRFTSGDTARVMDRRARGGDIVTLVHDITEATRQATELQEAREHAEAASRAKSAFLANMSHEIRTPMNGVVGMAEMLCGTALSDEQRLYADTIRTSGEALLNIINDVLDFSKIEANKLSLHPEPFDLERCIHEVLILLQAGARERRIDLLMDYDQALPTRFLADPGRMRQVLTNLLGNAVKFTEKGHVLIRVIGIDAQPGQHRLHVTIEDTGIGIAPEHLDHIFAEFAQVDEQSNRRFEGTGLGLAITRRLIEKMGGQIWVESEPGRGSCFGFSLGLPVAEDAQPLPDRPIRIRRVLVVVDQVINRAILERQLAAAGIAPTICDSARAALARLVPDPGEPAEDCDLVIADVEIAGFNGLDLATGLDEAGCTVPVMLLSSNPAALSDRASLPQIAAVLQKPILRRDLLRHLQDMGGPPDAAPPSGDDNAASAGAGPGRPMRVLAAEDNRTNRLVLSKMIADLDLELTFAEDGEQAVDAFRRIQPDLVFMDISMPRMDGREATRAIRQLPGGAQVAIVALTAHAMDGDEDDILAAGLDHYLTKPLRKPLLVEMINRYLPEDARPPAPSPPQGAK